MNRRMFLCQTRDTDYDKQRDNYIHHQYNSDHIHTRLYKYRYDKLYNYKHWYKRVHNNQ